MAQMESYRHGVPCWVDVTVADVDQAAAFYGSLFGWELGPDLGAEVGHYRMFQFKGQPIAGVMSTAMTGAPPNWGVAINVDDLDVATAKVAELGGVVMMGPDSIPNGSGRLSFIADPSGAMVTLWQAGWHAGSGYANEPGTVIWNDLNAWDLEPALKFWNGLCGWEAGEPEPNSGYRMLTINGRPIGGAMTMHAEQVPAGTPSHWLNYFHVADVEATVALAESMGASKLMGPIDMGPGSMSLLSAPDGATFFVMQPTVVDDPNEWPAT
jgi:uncharacterized protein